MITDNRITITVTDTEKGKYMSKMFNCGQCRASIECAGMGSCRLINYLHRNNFMQTNAKNLIVNTNRSLTKVNIDSSKDDFFKMLNIVDRAIRLRSHRYNIRKCR